MNSREKGGLIGPDEKPPAAWRSSLYDEPVWVSVAWIVGPSLLALVGVYLALR